ncbi:hypothetical protein L3X38_002512 [Prunus dulcis]|uniref:Integrase catalytic domain-containing protein n=1 Tax=Prunus dulcis TaxID=3755 RepID=A0AAD4WU56_PRUDU|nr:hypothetical protein L3X38_002512 [Prunus dulcis]
MTAYLSTAYRLLQAFQAYKIRQIPMTKNSHADALARLALAINNKDTNTLVKKCDKCQRFGNIPHIPVEPLTQIVSPWPFAQLGLDLIDPMSQGKGQVKYVVVAVDYFTKWVDVEALATITAARMEDFVWTHIFYRTIELNHQRTFAGDFPVGLPRNGKALVLTALTLKLPKPFRQSLVLQFGFRRLASGDLLSRRVLLLQRLLLGLPLLLCLGPE